MENIKIIYKILLRHWGYLLGGIFFMLGFALFSSVSLGMAVPLFDYVFGDMHGTTLYTTYAQFSSAVSVEMSNFFADHQFTLVNVSEHYKPLLDNLEKIIVSTDQMLLLWIISITLLILTFIKNIFFFFNKMMTANLVGLTNQEIRNEMFHQYLNQSLAFFGRNRVGDSLVRMVSDVKIVGNLFISKLLLALQNLILLAFYANVALILNARLFLLTLVILPVFIFILGFLGKKLKKYAKRIQAQYSSMFSNVEEVLNNIRVVKAFSKEQAEMDKYKKINEKYFTAFRRSRIYRSLSVPLSEMNGTLIGIIVLIVGGSTILDSSSDFTLGSFTAFLLAIFSMLHPMKQLTKAYSNIRKAMVSLDRISEIISRKSEIEEANDAVDKPEFKEKIEFVDISFAYEETKVLSNISLTIKKGEQVAFVGSSGSGKTTLVNLLARMYDVQSGSIKIDGIDIRKIKLQDLRTLFGTVTQQSILFTDTIANNISYGSQLPQKLEQIRKAAKIAYADEFIEKLPDNYNEILHGKASNLSGGQKQRICIARAIISNPPILIFDEATSALDTEAEKNVQQAIEEATKNRTVIMIAHRLSTVLASDKIVVMHEGKIVGVGPHEELLKTSERYQQLYNLQFAEN